VVQAKDINTKLYSKFTKNYEYIQKITKYNKALPIIAVLLVPIAEIKQENAKNGCIWKV
jgi:hypothetical protein